MFLFFQFLIGASVEGGMYLEFLAKVQVIETYRNLLLHASGVVLSVLSLDHAIIDHQLYINNSASVSVGYSCYGFKEFSLLLAIFIPFPAGVRSKMLYISLGSVMLFILNVVRIAWIAFYASMLPNGKRIDIDHHFLYDSAAVLMVLALFLVFISNEKRVRRIK